MSHRQLIFVLGMHRSGTSALARAVHLQGAALPTTLMPPRADNPEGFWESLPIVQFNNKLLLEAGRAWDDPRPIEPNWWRQSGKQNAAINQAAQLLEREFPEAELAVLKEPRISRLLPIWLAACELAGYTPRVLLCCRNPLEVAASLAVRNGIDLQRAQLLWLSHMLEAEHASRGRSRALIGYDALLTDWRGTLAQAYDSISVDALALSGETADTLDAFLQPGKRHHHHTTDQVFREERLSPLVKDTWAALLTSPLPPDKFFDTLRERLADAWSIFGMASIISRPAANGITKTSKPMATPNAMPEDTMTNKQRHVILHYHLFKNAGTSLDHILKQNFKHGWHEHEGPGPGWRAEDVTSYLQQHPEIVVLSSHTALLPQPVLPDTTIYPIIFIRHPLDRIRSIYEFERKQIADTEGARMAKETDMTGYIKWRLHRKGDRSIRDFQSYRIAFATPLSIDGIKLNEQERTVKAIATMPFIGVVERFDESLAQLQAWLKPIFPHINFRPTKANVTQRTELSLQERLDAMKIEIGEDLYEELVKANAGDLSIYTSVSLA